MQHSPAIELQFPLVSFTFLKYAAGGTLYFSGCSVSILKKHNFSFLLLYPHKKLLSKKDVWLQVPSCAFRDTVSFTLWFSCIVPNLQRTIISNLCRALWMVMTVDYINCAIKSSARVVSCINDHLMVLLPPSSICIQLMGCCMCMRFAAPPSLSSSLC